MMKIFQAIADVVESMKWTTFAAVYQNNDGLSRIQKALSLRRKKDTAVTIRRLGEGPDFRPILKEIRAMSICNVIIDVEPRNIIDVLYQAKEVKLLAEYCNFLITYLVLRHILLYMRMISSSRKLDSSHERPIYHNLILRTVENGSRWIKLGGIFEIDEIPICFVSFRCLKRVYLSQHARIFYSPSIRISPLQVNSKRVFSRFTDSFRFIPSFFFFSRNERAYFLENSFVRA